jgi:hypothetical protein
MEIRLVQACNDNGNHEEVFMTDQKEEFGEPAGSLFYLGDMKVIKDVVTDVDEDDFRMFPFGENLRKVV